MVLLVSSLVALSAQYTAPLPARERLAVGESVSAVLAAGGASGTSQRWELVADTTGPVTIALESLDFDAVLRIEGADGALLAEDDDSGVETDARVVVSLDAGRTYVVIGTAKDGAGELTLSARAGEHPTPRGAAGLEARASWRGVSAERALAREDSRSAAAHRFFEANLRWSMGQLEAADAAYEAAHALARESGDRRIETRSLGGLGNVRYALGDYEHARELYERWLALARELGERGWEARALGNLGSICWSLGDYDCARTYWEQDLALEREVGDRRAEIVALIGLGTLHNSLGDRSRAREHYEQALAVAREVGSRAQEAETLGRIGAILADIGDWQGARERYELHLVVAQELGLRQQELEALGRLGNVHRRLGDHTRALALLEQGLVLAREIGLRSREAEALGNLGNLYSSLGDAERARALHEEQLSIAREIRDVAEEARALGNLGNLHESLGDYERARELHEHDLALSRGTGERSAEAGALMNLGNVHIALGEYALARERYELALTLERELGDRVGEARAIGNLANVHSYLGDYERARRLDEMLLAIARDVGDRDSEAAALGALGNIDHNLGDHESALRHQEQCLEIARQIGDRSQEATALGNLGIVHRALGDLERARRYQEERLALERELGDRAGESKSLANLAALHGFLGEYAPARALADEADAIARELGSRSLRILPLLTSARASLLQRDADASQTALEQAEGLIDELSTEGLRGAEASGLRGRFVRLGQIAQDLAWLRASEAGDDSIARSKAADEGFTTASRWKGRALLEGIAEHRAGGRSSAAIALRRERREALAAREALSERVSRAIHDGRPAEEVDSLREQARALLAEAERLALRVREEAPQDAALDLALGAGPEDVRAAVLGPRELLIEYVAGLERLYAYVLGEHGLELVELGPQDEIDAQRERFLGAVHERERLAGPAEVASAGRALYERLLAPALAVAEHPPEHLVIVPGAWFAALPFEALVVESASEDPASFDELVFALDRFEITYGPSSPVLVELAAGAARKAKGPVLVLADPRYASEGPNEDELLAASFQRALPDVGGLERLPGTRVEALAIASALAGEDSDVLAALRDRRSGSFADERIELHLGEAASRARLAVDLRAYSVLHLACHGYVDAELPQRSGIALSPGSADDGFFTIADALELDLDCDLVVLSACQTARGEALAGEGVESLARAFLYAGARGLVASLWPVDDRAAARTMEAFYRARIDEGLPFARALREAKLALRRGSLELGPARGHPIDGAVGARSGAPETGHPFFWAPFIHVGLAR